MLSGMMVSTSYAQSSSDPADEPSAMVEAPAFEMRPRPTDEAEFDEYVDYLVEVADPRTDEQVAEDAGIKERFKDVIVVDSLAVGAPGFPAGLTADVYELGTLHSIKNNYDIVSWTITNAGLPDTPEVVKERMEATNAYWAERSEKYTQVFTTEDFYRVKEAGGYGVFHNFQGMMPLSQSGDEAEALANLQTFYDLGMRQLMFSYNVDTPYSDGGVSNSDGTDEGVHELGFRIIEEANRLGISIDCSHSSNKTCIEAAAHSTKPIMLSHSNAYTLQPIDRNTSDEAIMAVALADINW